MSINEDILEVLDEDEIQWLMGAAADEPVYGN
jgi:hypothetical protein